MEEWKSLCRLCACGEAGEIDIFVRDPESNFAIAEDLVKFCNLKLENRINLPSKICNNCYVSIMSLKDFITNSFNTQQMFIEFLQNSSDNWEYLRSKYKFTCANVIKEEADVLSIPELIESHEENILKEAKGVGDLIGTSNSGDASNYSLLNDIECEISIKNFKQSYQIKEITCAGNISNANKLEKVNNVKDFKKKPVQCKICEKKFSNQGGLTVHMKIKHSILKDPYKCKFCDKTFEIRSRLEAHENAHLPCGERKQLSCPHCEKKFNSEGGRWSHIHSVHDKKQVVICEECGKEFRTKRHLAKHKISHSNVKNLQCPYCPARFKAKVGLKAHTLIHGESFPCSICGILLNTKQLLKKHMVVHSDVKDFKCNFCNKEFKRSKDLHCHLIIHIGVKPYECRICSERFVHKVSYHRHLKATHPTEFAEMLAKGERISCTHFPSAEQLKAINEAAKHTQ
ncbi:zinc finger protein 181-like [Condylostylus longicornis]|uniref:zinc finger protein 181-like n=1 Tax=Condylostylus longicornis TaxID=2530218 RepID=UPI00244E2C06|nr:zinc finger protein 181-like [Condylostylus longicornis]